MPALIFGTWRIYNMRGTIPKPRPSLMSLYKQTQSVPESFMLSLILAKSSPPVKSCTVLLPPTDSLVIWLPTACPYAPEFKAHTLNGNQARKHASQETPTWRLYLGVREENAIKRSINACCKPRVHVSRCLGHFFFIVTCFQQPFKHVDPYMRRKLFKARWKTYGSLYGLDECVCWMCR